jgi:flagellar biosynthesis/type III secretory pathway M-ring protein FliF/YscJ
MSDTDAENFQGFSENRYQHTMHTLAWVSLWLIVLIGVAFGLFGLIWGIAEG